MLTYEQHFVLVSFIVYLRTVFHMSGSNSSLGIAVKGLKNIHTDSKAKRLNEAESVNIVYSNTQFTP
jgi:hypothetical protein